MEADTKMKEKKSEVNNAVSQWELYQLAREIHVPLDNINMIRSVFDNYDNDHNGRLDITEFEKLVIKLLDLNPNDPVPENLLFTRWREADKDGSGEIDFLEFCQRYSVHGFELDVLLSADEREMRRIAKDCDLSIDDVEDIKRKFDLFDIDKSGMIGESEFSLLLHKLAKCPPDVTLPASRIRQFWSEIMSKMENKASGEVNFKGFVLWYQKYFPSNQGVSRTAKSPMEFFYGGIRKIGTKDVGC